ncbi:hypothetical protein M404DRAFT_1007367 [Pisolithus tinctorius Marx 270]|uniref:Uncharacterized protein n=1 Tax=Pisolithus tinctorius Marx 270 TaxID=870435 RepID=A0A0C3JD29_PISTI|nr:hypothetical protein M404DRAFT_1007367 [Pisolithus tinctorius Marx 270]
MVCCVAEPHLILDQRLHKLSAILQVNVCEASIGVARIETRKEKIGSSSVNAKVWTILIRQPARAPRREYPPDIHKKYPKPCRDIGKRMPSATRFPIRPEDLPLCVLEVCLRSGLAENTERESLAQILNIMIGSALPKDMTRGDP